MASEIGSALFCHDGGDVALSGNILFHYGSCRFLFAGSVSLPLPPPPLSRQCIGAKPTHASVLLSSPTQSNGSALYLTRLVCDASLTCLPFAIITPKVNSCAPF